MITLNIDFENYMTEKETDPTRAIWIAALEHAFLDWHYLSVCNDEYFDHIKHKELFRFFFLSDDEPNGLQGICDMIDLPRLAKPARLQALMQGEKYRDLNKISIVCDKDKVCWECKNIKPYYKFWSFFYGKIILEEMCFDCVSTNPLRGRWPKEYDINKKVIISAYDILKKGKKDDRTISEPSSCSKIA